MLMKFTSSNVREYAQLGGRNSAKVRYGNRDPSTLRNKRFTVSMSEKEITMIKTKASATNLTHADLIIRAITNYDKAK